MEPEKNVLTVPIAIIVAGIIIGGALFFSRGGGTPVFTQTPTQQPTPITGDISLRAVDSTDHILGNPDASIVMVEFSDLECPFCKVFHTTMQTLIDQYGKTGQLAWVYRHFPLSIHPLSPKESEASECAFDQGGDSVFWAYIGKIFEITPSNNGLDPAKLPQVATELGLNLAKFQTCLSSGKNAAKIQADYNDGLKAGVDGTPNTVLILRTPVTAAAQKTLSDINQSIMAQLQPGSPNVITIDPTKTKVDISGAFPLTNMKQIIDLLLSGK